MKLSEAIRLGAMIRPQTYNAYFSLGGSCVLGAAFEAAGLVKYNECKEEVTLSLISDEWPFVVGRHETAISCPCCLAFGTSYINSILVHLNDYHHMTREWIADWVATIEPDEAPEPTLTDSLTLTCQAK